MHCSRQEKDGVRNETKRRTIIVGRISETVCEGRLRWLDHGEKSGEFTGTGMLDTKLLKRN